MICKVKKQIVLIVLLILALWCSNALPEPPRFFLQPEEGVFGIQILDPYLEAVSERLLPLPVYRKCQAVFLPAFSEESAVFLMYDDDHPKALPIVVSVRFKNQLWIDMHRMIEAQRKAEGKTSSIFAEDQKKALPQIHSVVNRFEAPIDTKVAVALENAWVAMLNRARYPKDDAGGLDGEGIHFANFTKAYGYRTGKVWSPDEGTPSFELVELARDLQKYPTLPEKERKEAAQALRKKAEKLIDRLKNMK